MKRLILVYLILLTVSASFAQPKWVTLNSGVTDGNLLAVDFPSDLVGYAVGHNGKDNYVLKTTDGGKTWKNVATSTIDQLATSVDFIDDNTGFLACLNGGVFMTKDGGTTWSKGFTGSNANMANISFPNDKTGYMCSGQGRFFKTTTGGTGWEVHTINIDDDLVYIKFFGSKKGVTVATSGRVWKTLDGGNTWDTINLDRGRVLFAHFLEENVGYICGPNGLVKRTVNGGVNWSNGTTQNHLNRDWYGIHFYETNSGFIGGKKGNIMSTNDGGSSWVLEHGDTTETVYAIVTTPAGHLGYAVGSNGMILQRQVSASIRNNSPLKVNLTRTNDNLTLSVDEPGDYFIRILDMNGRAVFSEMIYLTGIKTLNVDLPAGIFIISATLGGRTWSEKFMQQ